ncbi:hypothetical protein AJ80_04859 [Polytolypa hystricis UAMH7299]|uniref:VHS domain-containing protein n=1 Tax=Polytolypa hystricis (strain UAMH7299) TaxID=1447883 RepID=A0A2B7Y8P3_POLH7|nr:hypothetical protein AJ80_04859 [Polytolypa hystricis UAMH7299]
MFSGSKKPYSAITVQIERLTSEQYEVEDWSGIVDLVEVIRLQASGPSEASRALRKKLKYGNVHRQLRALTVLDFLIQNAGERFLRDFGDESLLERLRVAATDPVSDPEVKDKCRQLFGQWAASYSGTPGMNRITSLYKQLPKRKKPMKQQQSKVLRETEAPPDPTLGHTVSVSSGSGPSTLLSSPKSSKPPARLSAVPNLTSSSSKKSKDKSRRGKPFNMEKEKPEMLQTIAAASVASTNLMNALKLINRENQRISDDPDAMSQFEQCKDLRRQILRYIQHVESDDFLGGLIHANEELVNALIAFEVLDKSVDDDSDSDDGMGIEPSGADDHVHDPRVGLSIDAPAKPPRPHSGSISLPPSSKQRAIDTDSEESAFEDEDDDEDNPFGDRNAIRTPAFERSEPTW